MPQCVRWCAPGSRTESIRGAFYQGYSGLIEGNFKRLGTRDVSSIIQRGGTVLGSARCPEFQTEEGVELAIRRLKGAGIDGLVVIGGNGSQTGADALRKVGFPVVGVASTLITTSMVRMSRWRGYRAERCAQRD